MATLKKYDLEGKEIGELVLDEGLLENEASSKMIKDYIVAIRHNARQWSANTKGRKEVKATGKKPHAQKGGGRARQGCLAAPQYKGGGIVFGPKPKFDQHTRINKKERRKVIRFLLSEKARAENVCILKQEDFENPQTKRLSQFLKSKNWEGKRILFLGECIPSETADENWMRNREGFVRSLRNIPKVKFGLVPNVNGYDLSIHQQIVVLEPAIDELMAILGKISGE